MAGTETAIIRTREELADTIRDLLPTDWARLRRVAAYYAGCQVEAEDLLQEAFRRALNGDRKCPTHVDVVRFLAEAMRSMAHGEREKDGKRPALVAIDNHGAADGTFDPPDPAPDVEQCLTSNQEAAAIKAALCDLFEDDPTAQIILEGIMEGMDGEELRELTDMDMTTYQSKRRLIRRRVDMKFPEGWKR